MTKRRRVKQVLSLVDRLRQFAKEAKETAARQPQGKARDEALEKVKATERALQVEGWLASRELRPRRGD
jgi:hypothetical protein